MLWRLVLFEINTSSELNYRKKSVKRKPETKRHVILLVDIYPKSYIFYYNMIIYACTSEWIKHIFQPADVLNIPVAAFKFGIKKQRSKSLLNVSSFFTC